MLVYAVLLVIFLLLSAFFSSSETAFLSIQRVRLEHLVRERVPGAARVARLLERPRSLLSAILVGNNLVNTGAAAVGTAMAAELLTGGEAVLVATLAITVLLVIFGEVVPKTIALGSPFGLARVYAVALAFWLRLVTPAVWLLDRLSHVMLRLTGGQTDDSEIALTAAELRTVIRMGAESGTIEADESRRMLGALGLEQRIIREIMVPRVDVVAIDGREPLAVAAARLAETGFLRLPVYEDTPEEIVGYVHISDVNAARLVDDTRRARDVMRPAVFESEHASIARVLELMQQRATYLVMLVDEFGSTSGLVTIEDITEELVGELRSETGEAEEEALRLEEGRLVVEGGRSLVDLGHDIGVELTDIDANTVAGLILYYLRRFPRPGEHVDHAGYRFTVLESDERRIRRVAVEQLPEVAFARMHEAAEA